MTSAGIKRGALIVFEGCDKAGKTTQCRKLVEKLRELGITAQLMQFPDRTTATGSIINNYLTKKEELSDQAIHLLFSANRWENQPKMKKLLLEGVTLVIDRYSYSGVAYSAAKPGLDFNWCCIPEFGLPEPDIVFFLHLPPGKVSERKGFGEERYESNEFLNAVHKNFEKMPQKNWVLFNANRSIEDLHIDLLEHARDTIEKVKDKELDILAAENFKGDFSL